MLRKLLQRNRFFNPQGTILLRHMSTNANHTPPEQIQLSSHGKARVDKSFQEGYNIGFHAGRFSLEQNRAWKVAYSMGYEKGKKEGLEEGKKEGNQAGYLRGLTARK